MGIAGAGIATSSVGRLGTTSQPQPGIYRYDVDGMRFEFHAPTGVESLFDLRTDPRGLDNLCKQRPGAARDCREHLAHDLGVGSLDELRAQHADTMRRLHELGYL